MVVLCLHLSGLAHSSSHPQSNNGGEQPNGLPASIRFGQENDEDQIECLEPIPFALEGSKQGNKGMNGFVRQPADSSGNYGIAT